MERPAICPIDDRVLVRRAEAPTASAGGILLPNEKRPSRGTVLAAGPGRTTNQGVLIPNPCAVGDVVLYADWAAHDVPGQPDVAVVSVQDVLGVLEA